MPSLESNRCRVEVAVLPLIGKGQKSQQPTPKYFLILCRSKFKNLSDIEDVIVQISNLLLFLMLHCEIAFTVIVVVDPHDVSLQYIVTSCGSGDETDEVRYLYDRSFFFFFFFFPAC